MTARSPNVDLAIAALVLGIVSVVFSLAVFGALFALVGLALGAVYIWRHRAGPRGMAVSGIVLSSVGLLASAGFGALYYVIFGGFAGSLRPRMNYAELMAWVGAEAPSFTVTTLDGRALTLAELEGKRVVVDFWATWCGPCISEVPHLNQLATEHSADELVLIGISRESRDVIEPFVAEHGVVFPIASASDLPAPYSLVSALPTKFFIDRNGVIQSIRLGGQSSDALAEHALADDYAGEVRSGPSPARAERGRETLLGEG